LAAKFSPTEMLLLSVRQICLRCSMRLERLFTFSKTEMLPTFFKTDMAATFSRIEITVISFRLIWLLYFLGLKWLLYSLGLKWLLLSLKRTWLLFSLRLQLLLHSPRLLLFLGGTYPTATSPYATSPYASSSYFLLDGYGCYVHSPGPKCCYLSSTDIAATFSRKEWLLLSLRRIWLLFSPYFLILSDLSPSWPYRKG
jgi:hypothetical protein